MDRASSANEIVESIALQGFLLRSGDRNGKFDSTSRNQLACVFQPRHMQIVLQLEDYMLSDSHSVGVNIGIADLILLIL